MTKPAGLSLPRVSFLRPAFALGVLTLSCGCSGTRLPRDLMSEEVNAEKPVERPVAMRGEGAFLEGKLGAVATISRGFQREGSGSTPRTGGYEITARNRREDDIADTYGGFGGSEEDQKRAMEDYIRAVKAHRAIGSPMPPVTLRVQLENRGTEPLEVEVTDVNSSLGNFAVRPPKVTIAPGEKAALEPMISQLGVSSDEIPLQLAIRHRGKKEVQVLPVKNIIAASVRK